MVNAVQTPVSASILPEMSGVESQDFATILSRTAAPQAFDAGGQSAGDGRIDVSNLLSDIQSSADGSRFVNAAGPLESLAGLEFVGLAFGNSLQPSRDLAVNEAIQSGQVRNYAGSQSQVGGDWAHLNPIGDVLGHTVGAVGLAAGALIAEVPIIGNYDILGVSLLTPILNVAFGQLDLPKETINRNAVYNFGPRATAFENLGTAYGQGVADGLRGTNTTAPAEQKVPIWDDAMGAINDVLRGVASFNLPVISTGADFLRGLTRAAKGDEMFDIINSSSKDPMDPSWTAFSAPIGVLSSAFFKMAAPVLGLNQEAMDARLGRAVGDSMNVFDIFLPGDHTRHGFGSFFPRLIFGAPNINTLHGHVHQFDAVQYALNHGAPASLAMNHDMSGMSGMPSDLATLLAGSGIPGMDTTDAQAQSGTGLLDLSSIPGMNMTNDSANMHNMQDM